jgi:hypothetical protein
MKSMPPERIAFAYNVNHRHPAAFNGNQCRRDASHSPTTQTTAIPPHPTVINAAGTHRIHP